MSLRFSQKNKAFTIPELLVIIAVIGILAVLIVMRFSFSKARARDSKRISDINNLREALQMYYLDHDYYPTSTDLEDWCSLEVTDPTDSRYCKYLRQELVPNYIKDLPQDPRYPDTEGTKYYSYQYISTSSASQYKIHADLETLPAYEVYSMEGKGIVYNPPGPPSLPSVFFHQSSYSVNENGGSVTIQVDISGSAPGGVSVDFSTQDNTATGQAACAPGVDYVSVFQSLSWTPGDSSPKPVTIQICDDSDWEGNEIFDILLSDPSNASISGTNPVNVTIVDNESPPVNYPPFVNNPNPSDGATNVDVNTILQWTGGDPDPGDTVTYDVYFGTDPTPDIGELVSINQPGTTYDPGMLNPGTIYYWKIEAEDNHGATTTSPTWQFTTSIPSSGFIKAIGGSDEDFCYSLQKTNDGGYITAGSTRSFGSGGSDAFIVKLDSSGNLEWAKTIGGSNTDKVYIIRQTIDGGYVLTGNTESFGAGDDDFLIVKLDSSGNLEWAKTIGGIFDELAYSIQQTSDGGYIVGGLTFTFGVGFCDFLIVKLDSSGNLEWAKTIGGSRPDIVYIIRQTIDGGYVLTGNTESFGAGDDDFLIVKLDSSGNLEWAKTIGGSDEDFCYSLQQTNDGGYITAGSTRSFGSGGSDAFIVKLDSSGNLEWAKTIGGGNTDEARSVYQTIDGGYVITGHSLSFGGSRQVFLIKLDSSGNLEWAKIIGSFCCGERGNSVQQTSDNGYVTGGCTFGFGAGDADFFIIKSNSSGNSCLGSSITPTVTTPVPTVTTPNPTVTTPNPTVTTPNPTVTTPNPVITSVCP